MQKLLSILAVVVSLAALGLAQERVDFSVVEKIRAEGMDRSKALATFDYLTTVIGPRLTNSPAHKRAIAWTQEQMKALGLTDVHGPRQ